MYSKRLRFVLQIRVVRDENGGSRSDDDAAVNIHLCYPAPSFPSLNLFQHASPDTSLLSSF